jgi:hypothetical protein
MPAGGLRRRDLLARLLLLFSDRGLSAQTPGEVRDLGALLPTLAAASAGLGAPGDADFRRSRDPLPDLETADVDLVKVRAAWLLNLVLSLTLTH